MYNACYMNMFFGYLHEQERASNGKYRIAQRRHNNKGPHRTW